jgi:hypothetical protein
LIEQRLEQVMVSAIDQRYLHGLTRKCTRHGQTTEAAPYDDDLFAKFDSQDKDLRRYFKGISATILRDRVQKSACDRVHRNDLESRSSRWKKTVFAASKGAER